jgi:hypothetical protein
MNAIHGKPVVVEYGDPDLCDTEQIPLLEAASSALSPAVLAPRARRLGGRSGDKIGYEISQPLFHCRNRRARWRRFGRIFWRWRRRRAYLEIIGGVVNQR